MNLKITCLFTNVFRTFLTIVTFCGGAFSINVSNASLAPKFKKSVLIKTFF